MKKAWMLLLALLMTLGVGMANASVRSDSMNADISVVEDMDLIFVYPNKVVDYQNTVDYRLELLTEEGDDNWAGVLSNKCNKIGVLGVYMKRPTMVESYDLAAQSFGIPAGVVVDPTPMVDLFWGKKLSNMNIGVQLSYANNKTTSETTVSNPVSSSETINKSSQIGVRVGAGLKDLGPFQEANFALGYAMGSVENSYTASPVTTSNTMTEGDGISKLDINANLRHDLSENDNLKLYAGFETKKFALKYEDFAVVKTIRNAEASNSTIVLGMGMNHTVNEGTGLVSGGLKALIASGSKKYQETVGGVAAITNGDEAKTKAFALPIFVSTEAKVRSFLTLRAGAKYYILNNSSTETPVTSGPPAVVTTTKTSASCTPSTTDFGFNAGFALTWKNWTFDGMLDTDRTEMMMSDISLATSSVALNVLKGEIKYKF